jgi:hypothetical protein
VAAALASTLAAPAAQASEIVTRSASDVHLLVDGRGRALVGYRKGGRRHAVLAWGAVNARHPSSGRRQVRFRFDRSSGAGRGFRGTCGAYDGPPLAWLVAACKAPDGSYWAVQRWRRLLPNRGVKPRPGQGPAELRLSHWRGDIAQLTVDVGWSGRRYHQLFGTLTYRGKPVHGRRVTARGVPLDAYGRNIYVDTYDSAHGPGWRRENGFLARRRPAGGFCYGFYPHGSRPSGMGTTYRATAIGPGVTPDVFWQGPSPGRYDATRDVLAKQRMREIAPGKKLCRLG